MPAHAPGWAVVVVAVDQEKFLMTLPCTLVATLLATRSQMPTKLYAAVVPVLVQAVPPALAALPPMKFPLTVWLLVEVLLR